MNRALISIGIDKVAGLPTLRAAAAGAVEMADWGARQRMHVACLTDTVMSVAVSEIQIAVRDVVESGAFGQLIIYFSGHGFLKGPNSEIWLLSDAPGNSTAAVSVAKSVWSARNSAIEHIVFISDACRSAPTDMRFLEMDGASIFPVRDPRQVIRASRPEVDSFYATLPGDPALEVPSKDAHVGACGLFTSCVLQALNGRVPEVVDLEMTRRFVRSRKAKAWLIQEVPRAASNVSISLQQDPDIIVESAYPSFLSRIDDVDEIAGETSFSAAGESDEVESGASLLPSVQAEFALKTGITGRWASRSIRESGRASESVLNQMVQLLQTGVEAEPSFQTGFKIVGSKPTWIRSAGYAFDAYPSMDGFYVQVNLPEAPDVKRVSGGLMLIQFEDGAGIGVSVQPGQVATIVVEAGRVVSVSYKPSVKKWLYDDDSAFASTLDRRVSFAAAASRNGVFRLGKTDIGSVIELLSAGKVVDHALSLYAAYAFAQSGNIDAINQIMELMFQDATKSARPVPFDFIVLTGSSGMKRDEEVGPPWPLLSLGWQLLSERHRGLMPRSVLRAGAYLRPGLWTTFSTEGMALLSAQWSLEWRAQ